MKFDVNNQYWKVWGALVLLLVAVRATLELTTENSRFVLFSMYVVPLWSWVMYLNYRKGRDLTGYLEKNHHEKWNEITYVPLLGTNGFNSFRTLPFVFGNDNLNDEQVALLKKAYIGFLKFALSVFVSIIPLFLMVMLPW
jgi:hypothetical protein